MLNEGEPRELVRGGSLEQVDARAPLSTHCIYYYYCYYYL